MGIIIEKTFIKSARSLSTADKSRLWDTIAKIEGSPDSSGLNIKNIKAAKKLYSCRVNRNLRIILRHERETFHLVYVDTHDKAYKWAESATPNLKGYAGKTPTAIGAATSALAGTTSSIRALPLIIVNLILNQFKKSKRKKMRQSKQHGNTKKHH